ncbi:hypothetical protein LguiA_025623 [Lonicera macranthoides]
MAKKTQAAFSIFKGISSSIFHIGPEMCNLLLVTLSSDGYIGYACKLFDDMILRGVSLSTLGFGVFIWRFCTTSELGETLSLLDEVRKGDVSGINGSIIAVLVVHGLCLQSRVPEAISVLDELRKRNFKPDFMAYRIVAEALRLMGGVVDVEKVLKKKRKLGVAPRANDYREFILSLITERLINEAKELGQVIVDGNFLIQDDVLNALIGSVSTINPSCALKFLNFMLGKESFPTLLTSSNLCRSLCKHGKIDEMVEVFKVLSAKGYFVDLECYNVMILFPCKAGRVKHAYQVLLDMKKNGLSPEVSSYNSLMEACCREDLPRPAKWLWDEMFASGGRSGCLVTCWRKSCYNEKITDLLAPEECLRSFEERQKKPISLMEDGKGCVVLRGLEEEAVYSRNEIYNLLEKGAAKRRTEDTLLSKRRR